MAARRNEPVETLPARHVERSRPLVVGCAVAVSLLLGACQSQTTFRSVDLTPPQRITAEIPEHQLLDVGIVVFDPNVPDTYDVAQQSVVNAEVRRAESYYMPYLLKDVVESTGNWGAVRVVPEPTYSVDLLVTGKIVRSQGERLALGVRVHDARGVLWFERTYEALASKYAYEGRLPERADPFQQVYTRIADDLTEHFVTLTAGDRENIRHTAKMRFARDMLPVAYRHYLTRGDDGVTSIRRLPATDDPMMERVQQVRQREFLFIDTLDGHYGDYQRRVRPLYQTWRTAAYRESMAKLELSTKRRRQMLVGTVSVLVGIAGGPATFTAIPTGAEMLRDSLLEKNEVAMRAEALREVSNALESEVMPYTLELENKTVELTGTVEEQFAKLRAILRDSYFESLDLAPEGSGAGSPRDVADAAAELGSSSAAQSESQASRQ